MYLLACGGRHWQNLDAVLRELLTFPSDTTVVHGGCRGADRLAGEAAELIGFPCVVFPADWDLHGRAAGMIRNRQMLAYLLQRRSAGEQVAGIAFHTDVENSRGTRQMRELLLTSGISCKLVTQ